MKNLPVRFANSFKLLCAGLAAALLLPASAQAEILMNMGDAIKGESVIDAHKDWIELSSLSWGVSATYFPSASGGGSGKPDFRDLSWTQDLDRSFTGMFAAISTGDAIPNVTVEFLTPLSGGPLVKYFEMKFEGVHLTSLNMSVDSDSRPFVDGSFAYDTISLEYWLMDPKGKPTPAGRAHYDLREGIGSAAALSMMFARGLSGPTYIPTPVPEPEAYAMMLAGLGVLSAVARRRRVAMAA